jgi:preprotein translocase subunit SecB
METTDPGIRIAQIFLGKTLFEYTTNPFALPANTPIEEAKVDVQIAIGLDATGKKGSISMRVASTADSKGPYRFQLEMLGAIELHEDSTVDLREYLYKSGPLTLYPFVREAVANLTLRGRFGPIWLNPMNFAEISEQIAEQIAKQEEGEKKSPTSG